MERRKMSRPGYKDIPIKEEDYKIIEAFAKQNDRKMGASVIRAFKDAYGMEFSNEIKA
jgi:predicted nuclease of restriction endonuclease-like RecB superfamily